MTQRITFLLWLIGTTLWAQIPPNYYSTATSTGYPLKTQLHNIIKGHNDLGYDGLLTTYQTSDRDKYFENDNTVLDIYSERPNGADPYNFTYGTSECGSNGYQKEGDCYNREHIVPQSVFNRESPMRNDAFFVLPTDGKVNGLRSNFPFGKVGNASNTTANGSKLGPNTNSGYTAGYSGTVFEPIDEFKGDVARMFFYFATRYEDKIASYSYAMFDGSSNKSFSTTFLNILLTWHQQDPVSPFEIDRNNAIYARQNNRNPFIDHPEYVAAIWGTVTLDTEAPSVPTNLVVTQTNANSLGISWAAATDNTAVTSYEIYVNNALVGTTSSTNYTITGLQANTSYTITIKAKDAAGNTSAASNTLTASTNNNIENTTTVNDLFFSEYIEGSGNNKALEITNRTGQTINLSGYSIKKQSNGTGAWGSESQLSGTLANQQTYVIVYDQIASSCYDISNANLVISAMMSYNGNDPIGLFKNGVLIDVIGTFNSTSVFSENETLRRKSTATVPSTTFAKAADWDIFAIDTCGNLGTLGLQSANGNLYTILLYPNPSNGDFKIQTTIDSMQLRIFNFLGQKVFEQNNVSNHTVVATSLTEGIYMVSLSSGNYFQQQKLIIQ